MTHSEAGSTPSPTSARAAARKGATTTADIALIATFAALISVCAILPAITIGGLVPITLQTFGVLLAGAVLGAKRGFLTVLLYLMVGAIGIPVFANGSAGLAPFAGASAGYLVAMPFAAALTGYLVHRFSQKKVATQVAWIAASGMIANIVFMYPLGIAGLAWRAGMTVPEAFMLNLTFTPGDIIKTVLAAFVATAVLRAFPDLARGKRAPRAAKAARATAETE
ncbi:biotin transporter BioY [Leucobacter sp. UCMA 4100]|uniref:biotin transporter BioY n=1 Tax=Leucobacter sp. UCMA 4100 TaxID=2810534 RepID=UPI0022EB6DFB|nr:biotin transporter BioY [Leucobacter sp. UCMA 4100]MDA3147290.1 biotin transporter BioY [Leucobacter sp. UCMA 4100]